MSTISFTPVSFREQFTAFQCTPAISDATLQAYFDTASLYISNQYGDTYYGSLTLAQRTQALYLMTAHLTAISRSIATGQQDGIMVGASVDKVSVSLLPPPAKNQWQYWLQSTPYGKQLLVLLQTAGVGGFYIGGRPALPAFRR